MSTIPPTLLDRIQNEGSVHRQLVENIESITKRTLVCYIAHPTHPAGIIHGKDPQILESVLQSTEIEGEALDLLISTPGGDPNAAEKIVHTCRSYAPSFRVIVVGSAMSAGTLIAMGADEILMTPNASLGPIDPQMIVTGPQGQQQLRPAAAFVDAYHRLIEKTQQAIKSNEPPQPYLQLLSRIDPVHVEICLKAREHSRTLAVEFLSTWMLHGSKDKVEQVVEHFFREGEQLSQGRAIMPDKAQQYGLKIRLVPHEDTLSSLLWELQTRAELYANSRDVAKYLVSRNTALDVKVQMRPL